MEDKLNLIVGALTEKAIVKQSIYRSTRVAFGVMKKIAQALAKELSHQFKEIDEHVRIEYKEVNEFEFRLKFSGDLLIFTMHSNISRFPEEHILSKNPYIQEAPVRGYFGSIMVYNFMADSVKYSRLNDPGYLIARMLLNLEGHFYIEGVRQLNFLYPDIGQNGMTEDVMRVFIEDAMLTAINNDLMAPSFQDIQVVPLGQKLANQMVHGGQKVGFQMSYQKGE